MKRKLLQQVEEYKINKHRRHTWQKVVSVLGCIVVFCVTYALILPAITMENTTCGFEEHTHTVECYKQITMEAHEELVCSVETLGTHVHIKDCYDQNGSIQCGYADYVIHTHDSSCYDEDGKLVCLLPEHKEHIHKDNCYVIVQAEATEEAHTHTDECYTASGRELTCGLEETNGSTEDVEATETIERELTCTESQIEVHTHTSECYDKDNVLICGKLEVLEHAHTENCMQMVESTVDTETLTCQQEENESHQHTDICYGTWELTCELSEHTHTEECETVSKITDKDKAQVEAVIQMIDEMPSADEIDAAITDYEDAEDYDGEEAYLEETYTQVYEVYRAYSVLGEDLQTYVTNAEKLLELEYIWSAMPLVSDIQSDEPTIAPYTSTSEFIELNLYDYGSNINANYKINKEYPGFQWNGGAQNYKGSYNYRTVDCIDFGNSVITDLKWGEKIVVANQGGNINRIDTAWGITNRPIGVSLGYEVISRKLGSDGYPALADGTTSLSYLFKDGIYAKKQNTTTIDGLFQKDEVSGEYSYNSRENHAQYSNNKFTLYNQIITPNFILYPFGNFLPLNDITDGNKATQVSKIRNVGTGYMQKIIDRMSGSNNMISDDGTKQQLKSMLEKYKSQLGSKWQTWSSADAINDFLNSDKNISPEGTINLPLNSDLLKNLYNIDYDVATNFFLGMEMKMNFMQPKDGYTGNDSNKDGNPDYPMKFKFAGDDDVWVYIDDVLFLDLSGIHRHVGGEIDFVEGKVYYYPLDTEKGDVNTEAPYATFTFEEILTAAKADTSVLNSKGTFKDYSSHKFNFYYMERGSGSSVCRLNFNFPLLRKNTVSVSKELSVDEKDKLELLGNPDFSFQVMKEDGSSLFIAANTDYEIYDSNNNKIGSGTTDANGVFTLKANQTAVFKGIPENAGRYYVRELLETDVFEQYGQIMVDGSSQTSNYNVTIGSDSFKGVSSPIKDVCDGSTVFHFNNQVTFKKLGQLEVSKKLNEYNDTRAIQNFDFLVTLDGEPLAVGTEYTVGKETSMVETAGIITLSPDETAKISDIIAGSEFTVQELAASADGYTVIYQGGEQGSDESGKYVYGIIKTDASVAITVTNTERGTSINLPISKTVTNSDGTPRTFHFALQQVSDTADVETVKDGLQLETSITVNDVGKGMFVITYIDRDFSEGMTKLYYKVSEISIENGTNINYDSAVYVAEVTISKDSNGISAEVTGIWRDGTKTEGISFTNTLLGSLTVTKIVSGVITSDLAFTFEIILKDDIGQVITGTYPYKKGENLGTLSFDNEGKATIELKADESIKINELPAGTVWSITEIDSQGYIPSYTIGEEIIADSIAEGTLPNDDVSVTFINTQSYELPQTGGIGAHLYTLSGLVLMVATMICIYRKMFKSEARKS